MIEAKIGTVMINIQLWILIINRNDCDSIGQ